MEVAEVPVTDKADAMYVGNGTAVNVCFFNVTIYHQAEVFERTEQEDNLETPLRDVSLSHLSSSRATLRMYGFYYSRGTLSVTFFCGRSADNVTTTSTNGMAVGCRALNNGANVFLICGRYSLGQRDSCMWRATWVGCSNTPWLISSIEKTW